MMSKWRKISAVTIAAVAFAPAWSGVAQENKRDQALDRLDVTMALLPETAADTASVARRIELPPANRGAAGDGKPPADAGAPVDSVGQGRETAAEARERGRDFGQDVAEQARENRENAGKSEDEHGRPDATPTPPNDVPGGPGTGGRPETPGRPTP